MTSIASNSRRHAAAAHLQHRLSHARQRRPQQLVFRQPVEADDRQILRHPDLALMRHTHEPRRQRIVGEHDRGHVARRLEKRSRERGAGGHFVAAAREDARRIERRCDASATLRAVPGVDASSQSSAAARRRTRSVCDRAARGNSQRRRPRHGCRNERAAPGGRLRRARRCTVGSCASTARPDQQAISPLRFRDDQPVDTPLPNPFRRRCRDRIASQLRAGEHQAGVTRGQLRLDASQQPRKPWVLARVDHDTNAAMTPQAQVSRG